MALLSSPATYNRSGSPAGVQAGQVGDLFTDTTNNILYTCKTAGNSASAVWVASMPGTAALKTASNNSTDNVASVLNPTTIGQFASFSDTGGTVTNSTFNAVSFLQSANNLSDVANAPISRTNLGLGTASIKIATNNSLSDVSSVIGPTTIGHIAVFSDVIGTIQDGGAVSSVLSYSTPFLGQAVNLDFTSINSSINTIVPANVSYHFYVTDIYILVNSGAGTSGLDFKLTDAAGPLIATFPLGELATGVRTRISTNNIITIGAQYWTSFDNLPIVVVSNGAPLTAGNFNIQVEGVAVPV